MLSVDISTVPSQAEIMLQRIDERLAALGRTRYWLAKEATDGKNKGIITDLARKGFIPKEPRMSRIAELLGVSVDWLQGRAETPEPVRSEVALLDRRIDFAGFPARDGDPIPLVGSGDCASLELCDESGRLVSIDRSTFDPNFTVRYIRRPPALAGARDIYAIEFRGESMLDRYADGEVGLVDPGRPPRAGDFVLVQLRERRGSNHVGSVLAKRLVRTTATDYVLEQLNPRVTFLLPREQVVRMHRIMGPNDLLF